MKMSIEIFLFLMYSFVLIVVFSNYTTFFFSFIEIIFPCPYNIYSYFYNFLFFMMGFIFNIYYGANKWHMQEIEDMYMIVLSDTFSSKIIFLEKLRFSLKSQNISYNLKTYTLMKRVKIPITDKVKKVIKFINDDD